ncbi:MAG: cytochrome b/b6 domain-containing protein [Brachymonas sp.]|nr:cytochrome b/b6 domain-containing protein [Brachymonas sp.]
MTSSAPTPSSAGQGAAPTPGRRTVDAPIRMFHALFALTLFGAYITAESDGLRAVHVTLGYTMIGLLAFRLVYGIVGPPQARLGVMLRKLGGVGAWLRSFASSGTGAASPWRQGQNLLMAWLIVALLLLAIPLTLSGYGLYHGWRDVVGRWIKEVHEVLGNGVFALALAHIGVVLLLSILRKRNMPWTMVTGRIPGPGPDLVKQPRTWLAALVLLGALGFAAWQWQQTPGGLLNPAANNESQKKRRDHGLAQTADQHHDKQKDDDDD